MASRNSWLAEFIKSLTVYYGLVAALFYAMLHLTYFQFYTVFDVSLREVGLTKAELLSDALIGPLVLAVLIALISFLWGLVNFISGSIYQSTLLSSLGINLAHISGGPQPFRGRIQAAARVMTIVSIILGIIWVGLFVFSEAIPYANDIKDKGALSEAPRLKLGKVVIPLLETQAYAATVLWKDPMKTPKPFKGESAGCLIHLGQSGSTVVVYDFKNKKPIYFPAGDAIIEQNPLEQLPDSCKPQIAVTP
jgi:hypothetical protein